MIPMTGYGFFNALRFGFVVALVPLAGVLGLSALIYDEVKTEVAFHHRYGAEWRDQYEGVYGSLSEARTKMVVSAVGIGAIGGLSIWVLRLLQPNAHPGSHRHSNRRHRRHHHQSSLERWAVHRRKALVGIYFGTFTVIVGGLLAMFHLGIFADHGNELILALFVFIIGYLGVVTGCSNWLKAKGWNPAIVAIAFLPFGILVIPFVRIIFIQLVLVSAPTILPAMMLMMAMTLVVVVAALPDRSGFSKRKPVRSSIHGLGPPDPASSTAEPTISRGETRDSS